ncbi:hypothetical protein J6590_008010 [Homalodisca vitripennis]|nr:hypothetical protein J6590_008010 [Homalodisca vitripennis]
MDDGHFMSQVSQKSGTLPWELEDSGGGRSSVPHASSLDAISRRQRTPEAVPTPKVPSRSATCSVLTSTGAEDIPPRLRPHTLDNFSEGKATEHDRIVSSCTVQLQTRAATPPPHHTSSRLLQ